MNRAAALHNFWHGNVETSTDTLVPVIESHPNGETIVISPSAIDDLPALPRTDELLNGTASIQRNGDVKPRILPEVHHHASSKSKSSAMANGNGHLLNDSNDHQRMGSNGASNSSAFNVSAAAANQASLYRRRRNSSNSRQAPLDLMSPNGLPQRSANGR